MGNDIASVIASYDACGKQLLALDSTGADPTTSRAIQDCGTTSIELARAIQQLANAPNVGEQALLSMINVGMNGPNQGAVTNFYNSANQHRAADQNLSIKFEQHNRARSFMVEQVCKNRGFFVLAKDDPELQIFVPEELREKL